MPGFVNMKDDQKFLTLMCPTTVKVAKLTNKMIKFMFEKRAKIEEGFNPYELQGWKYQHFKHAEFFGDILYTSQHGYRR